MANNDDTDQHWQQMQAVLEKRDAGKKARFQRSKVDRFRAELEDFSRRHVSLAAQADWLATYKRVKVHPSTIAKRLAKWRKG